MLAGAFLGFAIGVAFGWLRENNLQDIFWRACLGMYAGGMLVRWWGRSWVRGLHEACEQRAAVALAAAEAAARESKNLPATSRS